MQQEQSRQQTQTVKKPLGWGPWSSILISAVAYISSQLVLVIPIAIISLIHHGQNAQNIIENSDLLTLGLTTISSATIILILLAFLKSIGKSLKDLGFKKFKLSDIFWLIIGAALYLVVVTIALTAANLIPGFNGSQAQDVGYQGVYGWQIGLAFVGLIILPAFAEEMLFRGFLYRGMASRWPKIIAALLASLMFATVHFQWNVGVDVFVLSMIMIFVLEKTQNLWVTILMHALKNGAAFLALFIFT